MLKIFFQYIYELTKQPEPEYSILRWSLRDERVETDWFLERDMRIFWINLFAYLVRLLYLQLFYLLSYVGDANLINYQRLMNKYRDDLVE